MLDATAGQDSFWSDTINGWTQVCMKENIKSSRSKKESMPDAIQPILVHDNWVLVHGFSKGLIDNNYNCKTCSVTTVWQLLYGSNWQSIM